MGFLPRRGTARAEAQPEAGATYAHRVDKAEALVDWRHDAAAIERRVRDNIGYDEIVAGIVLARSRKAGQTYEDFVAEQSERTRSDFTHRLAEEFGKVLADVDVLELAEQLLEGRTIEVKAEFKLGPKRADPTDD